MHLELIQGISQLSGQLSPSVVTIGNFDGVHLGHQHVIHTLLQQAQKHNCIPTVVTFEPLAKEFFVPESTVRLNTLEQKSQHLFDLGVQRVLCIDFTEDFTQYSPQRFVDQILVKGLKTRFLSVGDDFRFGKNRAGDFDLLKLFGDQNNFSVQAHDTFEISGERVSSGRVRTALSNSNFELAATLLGRPYTISGEVVKGRQLGRTIGFPTANIVLPSVNFAVNGVYAVIATLANGESFNGVANIGHRPTLEASEHRLEVHLFDYAGDLYGQVIEVEFSRKLREEKKFDSFDLLKRQIERDAVEAQQYFLDLEK